MTLSGLTSGASHETALLRYGWVGAGRTEVFASGGDSRGLEGRPGSAGGGSAGTFHLCAPANRPVSRAVGG